MSNFLGYPYDAAKLPLGWSHYCPPSWFLLLSVPIPHVVHQILAQIGPKISKRVPN